MSKSLFKMQLNTVPFWESIGFRIALGILLPLGLAVYTLISISGFYNYYVGSYDDFSDRKENIERNWSGVRIHELSYRVKLAEIKYSAERFLNGDKRKYRELLNKLIEEFNDEVRHVYRLSGDDHRADGKKIYNSIFGSMKYLQEYLDSVERESISGDSRRGEETRNRILILTTDIESILKRLKARFELYELQDQEAVRAEYQKIRDGVMTLTIFVILFGLVICALVTYTISSPVKKVTSRLRDIAAGEGDLTKRVQTRTIGEMREVAMLMNEFLENLHEIISTIRGATETINESVSQVSKQSQFTTSSAVQINKNMMTQSMNLEDCSVSLSRIDELLQSNGESTRQAASLSRLAMDRALKGGSSVQETVGAMEKMEESAKKVEFLVSTIQGIATQTNLLAINAAIEASKAGEHGKGFAVVAEEVRKLAERSKGLTVEVTDLISEVNSRVKVGSNLARGAGTALDGIIKDVEAVSSLIQRIASASTKQTESSSRLLSAIQIVNQAVRQNLTSMQKVSRGAEVATTEVEKLIGMIMRLNNVVKQFKLREFHATLPEYYGNMGVTNIPNDVIGQINEANHLDIPYDTDEFRPEEVENSLREIADMKSIVEEAEAAPSEASASNCEAMQSVTKSTLILKKPAPKAEPEVFELDAEDVPAVSKPELKRPPAARKKPDPAAEAEPADALLRAPKERRPGLVPATKSADMEGDADDDQSFFTADELSKEILVGDARKTKTDEDVA